VVVEVVVVVVVDGQKNLPNSAVQVLGEGRVPLLTATKRDAPRRSVVRTLLPSRDGRKGGLLVLLGPKA